ncbi:class D sortase [Tepidanaerobacter sp. EBM-38]|uniref:class D sortase n=1 Tax=Tepidanaerobacter sp. EBM-38 TaxID=1918496 RepID=UPI0025DB3A37|nr:class D sortase [Tepidanaerobacter sp. EBM-38]
MRKIIAVILIFLGIFLMTYPKLRETYFDYQQRKLLATWSKTMNDLGEYSNNDRKAEDYFPAIESKLEKDDYRIQYINSHMEGVLKIEKIGLSMPILTGATKANLDISAAAVDGTGKPGEVGNYCISAHRSRTYGRQFNRLNELEKGDQIEIINKDTVYRYEVFEKLLVEAKDAWVMFPQKNEKLLTLITCDYSRKPYPRLVVRAKFLESGEESSD